MYGDLDVQVSFVSMTVCAICIHCDEPIGGVMSSVHCCVDTDTRGDLFNLHHFIHDQSQILNLHTCMSTYQISRSPSIYLWIAFYNIIIRTFDIRQYTVYLKCV